MNPCLRSLRPVCAGLLGLASVANATVIYQNDFQSFNEPTDAVYINLTAENVGNAFLGKWVAPGDPQISAVEQVVASGDFGLGVFSNNNNATRAVYYTINAAGMPAGPSTLSFAIDGNYATTTLRVGVWVVNNGSGTTGNANLYDVAQGVGTPFSDMSLLGVFGGGDATSTLLGSGLVLAGTAVNDLAGNYSYEFNYPGTGNLVLGFSVEGNNSVQFVRRVVIDDIAVVAVPEPSTFALLAVLGILGFVVRRRRA